MEMILKLISGFAVLSLAWTLFLWRLMADPIRRVAVTAPNLPKYEDVVAKVEANKRADFYDKPKPAAKKPRRKPLRKKKKSRRMKR